MHPIRFGIIGSGWRAEFFLRAALAAPQVFEVAGMAVRRPEERQRLTATFGVTCYESAEQLLDKASMTYVVVSVPHAAAADMVVLATEAGVPVLCETSLAGDVDYMVRLWNRCRDAKVQIAEQYPFQPHHAARLAVLAQDRIGTPSYMHVAAAHGHHAMALVRKALRIGFENPTVTGQKFFAPIIKGPGRNGPPAQHEVVQSRHHLAVYHFGDKMALYDFCGDIYMSPIRGRRILVRGERGELNGDRVTWLEDFQTPMTLELHRHESGLDGKMDGYGLHGIQAGDQWVYRNPLPEARLTDEELAVATCMLKMNEYLETGRDFYSLADACQDAYLGTLELQAIESGQAVTAQTQPWAE